MNYNKLILVGRLTRDPELRHSQQGSAIVKFGIAVDDGYGENKKPMFVDVSAFGKTAENLSKFFAKGDPILLDGKLTLQQWEKDGVKRSKHEMVAFTFDFIGGKQGQDEDRPARSSSRSAPAAAAVDDDCPF